MSSFATVKDLTDLWRDLTQVETVKANALLPVISDTLRHEATLVGKDLDEMVNDNAIYANVVKSVVVDVVGRMLLASTDNEPMTDSSQSALGYTVSQTYLVPGGGMFIKNSELKKLGLRRQRYGVVDFYGQT